MALSQGRSRHYQLSMAVVCTLLASAGFIGAGYAETSPADNAAATAGHVSLQPATEAPGPESLDFVAAQGLGVGISFANTVILAQKPMPKPLIDLAGPGGEVPPGSGVLNAMREDVPEYSADMISTVRKEILQAAYQGLGHSYVWGGTSFENGWDCSGFVQWAYGQAGVTLPRTEQWVPMVETTNPQPGDIVVQNPDGPNHWSHIGIYVGHGEMISALNPTVGTVMGTPQSTSNSSTYFTMPGFAVLDQQAAKAAKAAKDKAAKAAAAKAAAAKAKADKTTKAATDKATPGKSDKPAPGITVKPTPDNTDKPTAPVTTPPATTTPPTTDPATTVPPTTTPPTTTPPAATPPTTDPATTPPPTTMPAATPPSSAPATSASEAPATTGSGTTAPPTTAFTSPGSAATSAGPPDLPAAPPAVESVAPTPRP